MSAGTTSGVALLLALAALGAGWHVEAAPARAGDIVLDNIPELSNDAPGKGYFEVRSPNGTLRGRINLPSNMLPAEGMAVTRKLAFTLYADAIYVSSISSGTYKIVARPKLPRLHGDLARCWHYGTISAAGTKDSDVTELYVPLGCYAPCPVTGARGDRVVVFKYSSTTRKLSVSAKTFPLYYKDQCVKKQGFLNIQPTPTPPAIIRGVPYAVGDITNSNFDVIRPSQVHKLTVTGAVALGGSLPSPLKCTPNAHVAGVASSYALCKTGKTIGLNRKLPQAAMYQFRNGKAPRLVGRLPSRTTISGATDYWVATAPNANPKVGRTLYVIGATLIKDVRFNGNIDDVTPDKTLRYDIFSLDKTKITSPFRRRWRVPSGLQGRVALHVVP